MRKQSISQQIKAARQTALDENRDWFENFMEENSPGWRRRNKKMIQRERRKIEKRRLNRKNQK
jgi:hypothetical protein